MRGLNIVAISLGVATNACDGARLGMLPTPVPVGTVILVEEPIEGTPPEEIRTWSSEAFEALEVVYRSGSGKSFRLHYLAESPAYLGLEQGLTDRQDAGACDSRRLTTVETREVVDTVVDLSSDGTVTPLPRPSGSLNAGLRELRDFRYAVPCACPELTPYRIDIDHWSGGFVGAAARGKPAYTFVVSAIVDADRFMIATSTRAMIIAVDADSERPPSTIEYLLEAPTSGPADCTTLEELNGLTADPSEFYLTTPKGCLLRGSMPSAGRTEPIPLAVVGQIDFTDPSCEPPAESERCDAIQLVSQRPGRPASEFVAMSQDARLFRLDAMGRFTQAYVDAGDNGRFGLDVGANTEPKISWTPDGFWAVTHRSLDLYQFPDDGRPRAYRTNDIGVGAIGSLPGTDSLLVAYRDKTVVLRPNLGAAATPGTWDGRLNHTFTKVLEPFGGALLFSGSYLRSFSFGLVTPAGFECSNPGALGDFTYELTHMRANGRAALMVASRSITEQCTPTGPGCKGEPNKPRDPTVYVVTRNGP